MMNKPFYQLFIIHFIGAIVGILVIAGYYDVFNQAFVLFDFTLAFWTTALVLLSYTIYKVTFKETQKAASKNTGSLQGRLLLSGILLSFWLPAVLNYVDGSSPQKKENKNLLTSDKRSKQL